MGTRNAIGVAVSLFCLWSGIDASIYISPSGAGSKNGTSPENAFDKSALSASFGKVAPGDTIFLEGGTYQMNITISGSGTALKSKVLMGRTPANPPVISGVSGRAISINGVSYWVVKNFKVDGLGTAVYMDKSDKIQVIGVSSTGGYDPFWLNAVTNVKLIDCSAVKYEKKGMRISKGGGENVEFIRCLADATGGDNSLIASRNAYCMGFWYDVNDGSGVATRNVVFRECTARNNLNNSSLSYKNGDGFCGENPASGITFEGCLSYDNQDGGFDVKSNNVTYRNCIAFRNYRGFRAWEGTHTYTNCISGYNRDDGQWSGRGATVNLTRCTYVGNERAFNPTDGGTIAARDCIIFGSPTGSGTLTGCVTDDPKFKAPSTSWKGTPPDAFNSLTYGNTKGYYSAGLVTQMIGASRGTLGGARTAAPESGICTFNGRARGVPVGATNRRSAQPLMSRHGLVRVSFGGHAPLAR